MSSCGYDGIEVDIAAGGVETLLFASHRYQIKMPQAHFPLTELANDIDPVVETCRALGIHTVVSSLPLGTDVLATASEWERLASKLGGIEERLRRFGLRFAWRNGAAELLGHSSHQAPIDLLLQSCPGMDWQIDIGWIVRLGQSPADLLNRHTGRIVSARLLDINGDQAANSPWAVPGYGLADWSPIYQILKAMPRLATYVAYNDDPAGFHAFASRWKIAHERLISFDPNQLFLGFTHVALKVLDIQAQLRFYQEVMGFREMFRLNNADGTLFLVYLRINDHQYLELFPGAVGGDTPSPDDRGYQHICLDVENLDLVVATLRDRGAKMCLWHDDLSGIYEVDGTAITLGRDGNRQSWVKDPEGNRIELMELALGGSQFSAMEARLLARTP